MVKNYLEYIKKIVWIMSKKQRVLGGALLFLVFASAIIQLLSVYAVAPLVSAITDYETFMETKIVRLLSVICRVYDYKRLIFLLCISIAILYFIKEAITLFQSWFSIKFSQKVQRELSQEVFRSYLEREYDFFLNYGTSKILRDINDDPNFVYNMLIGFVNLFTELITSLLLLVYVVLSDTEMALCLAILTGISLFILIFGLKRKLLVKGEEARIGSAYKQKTLLEAIEGIKEVQVMKKQKSFEISYVNSFIKAQKPMAFQAIAVTAPTSIIEGIFVIGIVIYIGFKALNDNIFLSKLPILASFLVAAIRMLPSIGRITNNVNNIQFCVPALNSVYSNISIIREMKKSIEDNPVDSERNIEFKNALNLKNISYRYEDSSKDVLKDLTLSISKGESIGIVGQSGAGKSTLADLILGLHMPKKGIIELDGVDINKIPYEYSRVIGYVPQNVYLVDGTIRENIAFGVNPKEVNDDDLINSLKKAKLYDYVMSTENGIDTLIGERGVKFSGGQRQRLAIARALYRKPQILILDEATSALDNETETAVMEQVEEMQGTVTLIIIAHRLSTIEKCDHVYEIAEGKARKIK